MESSNVFSILTMRDTDIALKFHFPYKYLRSLLLWPQSADYHIQSIQGNSFHPHHITIITFILFKSHSLDFSCKPHHVTMLFY